MALTDSHERSLATEPNQSFIVEAPAGSGKTEILTQRYLRLLSTVEAPEEIIALTFTRKAASEMRERILLALGRAKKGERGGSAHQQQTFLYASKALQRSEDKNWQIVENPSRLKIMTLDSLCQMINQAIPLHDKQIPAFAKVTENGEAYYAQAAKALLRHALQEPLLQQPLKDILLHLDNRQDKFILLISQMLANRSQWLEMLYSAKNQNKDSFLQMLKKIEAKEIQSFMGCLDIEDWQLLANLSCQMASIEENKDSPRYCLKNWKASQTLTREIISGLAALILTSDNKLRKGFDHHVGLKKGNCPDTVYKDIKDKSKDLLAYLNEKQSFLTALIKAKQIPEPTYSEQQWLCLTALFTFLPLAVAFLHLLFQENEEVDFNAITEQALFALGTEDEPTDLALYLDHSIHHLLIDEFQDTSIQQFQLLKRLVQGFELNQGKTLFLVGDPMQSIYRFRQAEVGLFLKAKKEGIGPVKLDYLALTTNFRSTENIIVWINKQFKTIFPAHDDIEFGAIAFHPSQSALSFSEESEVKALQLADKKKEAQAIADLLEGELNRYPKDRIAILVRSRNQLKEIVPLLRQRKISFQGVDIEPLCQIPYLRDLLTLTKALVNPTNRLYWLSLLRSPYCGLNLKDLHAIAHFSRTEPLLKALKDLECLTFLSAEGQLRVRFFAAVMEKALASRHQKPLSQWIKETFQSLNGDAFLNEMDFNHLEQFWQLLDKFHDADKIPDIKALEKEFNTLYAKEVNTARVEIMTIHKSKGLEFDSIILPGLGSKPTNKDKPLLRFLTLPTDNEQDLILVSPLKADYEERCSIYDYLGKLDEEKNAYELQRLLYVATTRAKKRLYLFDSKEDETKNTFRELLNEEFLIEEKEEKVLEDIALSPNLVIPRLPIACYLNLPILHQAVNEIPSLLTDSFPKLLGVLSHELLQTICDKHLLSVDSLPWEQIKRRLTLLGSTKENGDKAYHLLYQQLKALFDSEIGQWLIKPHLDEQNEYELLIEDNGQMATRIIDRTFIDKGIRWIIDFKTGSDEMNAQKKHQQQVNAYAELFQNKAEPIHCGLYYLATGRWLTWQFEAIACGIE